MQIKVNTEDRKKVVEVIKELYETESIYLGTPTFAYKIKNALVTPNGDVEIDDEDEGMILETWLLENGLIDRKDEHLDIDIPMEGHTPTSLRNLLNAIYSKQYFINRAVKTQVFKVSEDLIQKLQEQDFEDVQQFVAFFEENKADSFGIHFSEEKIHFDNFPYELDKVTVFAELTAMMSSFCKQHSLIHPKATIVENEKYYFRAWLVRIGLGGKGGQNTRKVLLKNLKGHTAFRTEADKEKWKAKNCGKKQ